MPTLNEFLEKALKNQKIDESKITPQKASQIILKLGKDWESRGKKSFKNDPEMIKTYKEDSTQYKKLSQLIKKGDLKKAFKYADGLDTILRDGIPDKVWKWLMFNAEGADYD